MKSDETAAGETTNELDKDLVLVKLDGHHVMSAGRLSGAAPSLSLDRYLFIPLAFRRHFRLGLFFQSPYSTAIERVRT